MECAPAATQAQAQDETDQTPKTAPPALRDLTNASPSVVPSSQDSPATSSDFQDSEESIHSNDTETPKGARKRLFTGPGTRKSPRKRFTTPSPSISSKKRDLTEDDLPLCGFSPTVVDSLKADKASLVWDQLVHQCVYFYNRFHKEKFFTSRAYQIVGKKLYNEYPAVGRSGHAPWVFMMILYPSNFLCTHTDNRELQITNPGTTRTAHVFFL